MRLLALALALPVIAAGCASPGTPCREGTPAEGEAGVCFVSDGWVLRGGARDGGDGPVVLLVPGAAETRRAFDALSAALGEAGFRVLSFDLRGHGESTRGGEVLDPRAIPATEWNRMVLDLQAAANLSEGRWGARPSAVVGSDVGSSLALHHAVREDVPALVLLSPGLNYRGVFIEKPAAAFDGAAFVVAGARDAASAETAERMQQRMPRADVAGVTVAGGAHGTDLLQNAEAFDAVRAFVAASADDS